MHHFQIDSSKSEDTLQTTAPIVPPTPIIAMMFSLQDENPYLGFTIFFVVSVVIASFICIIIPTILWISHKRQYAHYNYEDHLRELEIAKDDAKAEERRDEQEETSNASDSSRSGNNSNISERREGVGTEEANPQPSEHPSFPPQLSLVLPHPSMALLYWQRIQKRYRAKFFPQPPGVEEDIFEDDDGSSGRRPRNNSENNNNSNAEEINNTSPQPPFWRRWMRAQPSQQPTSNNNNPVLNNRLHNNDTLRRQETQLMSAPPTIRHHHHHHRQRQREENVEDIIIATTNTTTTTTAIDPVLVSAAAAATAHSDDDEGTEAGSIFVEDDLEA